MGIEVFVADEQQDQPVDTLVWARLARNVLEAEGIRGDVELSVMFVDELTMADLNQRFMGKEGPTDVLSFPLEDDNRESGRSPDSGGARPGDTGEENADDVPALLGDVVLCPAVAERNAPEHAGTYDEELALLVVHGILHLVGMDHEVDEQAEIMEARERELLNEFYYATETSSKG